MPECLSCGETLDAVTNNRYHPTCEVDPDLVAAEVFSIIKDGIANQPRTLQSRIGPSEIGHPCLLRIGHKLADTEPVNDLGVAWKPFVGTAVHAELADIFARREVARYDLTSDLTLVTPRWHVEEKVTVGYIDGVPITGTADLMDEHSGGVIDWKITTRSMIREYRSKGPGSQYRTQGHLYGRGFRLAGYDVRFVAIVFFTREGEFTDRYVWWEPYDEQVAVEALERVETVKVALDVHGAEVVLPLLPRVASWCNRCPYFRRNEDDLTKGCPGALDAPADALEEVFQ